VKGVGRAVLVCLIALAGTWSCREPGDVDPGSAAAARPVETTPSAVDPRSEAPRPDGAAPLVVFLGDSLTAGLGLAEDRAFPALVARQLGDEMPVRVVNAGVSGDTTSGGLRRLDWLLRQDPDLLVVELGANDALRGQSVEGIEKNLRAIVGRAREAGVPVLLVGLRIPPSYGAEYAESFRAIYPAIARDLDVPLVPFLLEGVAGHPDLNQPDGIHPTAEGHQVVAETVGPWVLRALGERP